MSKVTNTSCCFGCFVGFQYKIIIKALHIAFTQWDNKDNGGQIFFLGVGDQNRA